MMPLDLRPVLPAILVAATALLILVVRALTPRQRHPPSAGIAFFGLLLALASVLVLAAGPAHGATTAGSIVFDDFAIFLHVLLIGVALVVVLFSPSYLEAVGMDRAEYYALVLFSLTGMLGLVSSLELISIFVALEIMSVALYALAGMRRDRIESQESALKYFVTGAFSSAFFLYGVALLYGVGGGTSLDRVARGVAASHGPEGAVALLGAGFLLVGFGFKVASVPFHMWAPDVYEGAPTTVTALMSAGVKVAAFGALLRVFGHALPTLAADWKPLVASLAVLSMLIGNLGALVQTSLKRMLAFSSVAHAGYLLVGLVAAPQVAVTAILFYLVAYAAVNLGGFGALASLARAGREPLSYADVSGLADRRPGLAAVITVFMISLTGVPISAGFVGKFYLFNAAVGAGYVAVALVGVLMSVVSAYYYLGVVVAMYMKEPAGEDVWGPVGVRARLALASAVAVVLVLGVYPAPVLDFARQAARAVVR